jgi:hypothetical protein
MEVNEANGTNESLVEAPSPEASVPRADYDKLLIEATTAKEKATLFDEMLQDPDFLEFLNKDDAPKPAAAAKPVTPGATSDVKALQQQVEALTSKLENLGKVYGADREAFMRLESHKLIDTMTTDKENYPFFDDKAVKEEMAVLLEQGRAVNMQDAYRLATYSKSVATGRNQVVSKKGIVTLPLGQRTGSPLPAAGGKRSLQDILGDALDKTGVVLTEGEE